MGEAGNKLSLVSQFDDLCRHQGIFLEGQEADFLKFVRNQEICRLRWLQAETELKTLQEEYEFTLQEIRQWKIHFEDMKTKMLTEQKKRLDAEHSLRELSKLFGEVKEVVNRDTTLADQTKQRFAAWQKYEPMDPILETEATEEFDKTDEMLDFDDPIPEVVQNGKRRSSGARHNLTPPKRKKSAEAPKEVFLLNHGNTSIVATTTVSVPNHPGQDIVASSKIDTFRHGLGPAIPNAPPLPPPPPSEKKRRSRSEPDASFVVEPTKETRGFREQLNSDPKPDGLYPSNILASLAREENVPLVARKQTSITPRATSTSSMPFRQQTSGSKLNSKRHDFASKTVIRPETCVCCGRRIKFSKQALKCHNCRTTCHPECKGSVPLPCIPFTNTPTNKAGGMHLADFVAPGSPKVPALIVHSVQEVDSREPKEVGLYRLSAPEREVKELKEKFFKGKGTPNLSNVDVHVLCAVIKDFLRNLDEPLIPMLMWKDFTDAASMNEPGACVSALYQKVNELPPPNRDTLAYLIIHWQRIAENPDIKMPVKNLATVLGPTVVGFSSKKVQDADTMMREQALQVNLMEKLLTIRQEFWYRYACGNEEDSIPFFPSVKPKTKPSDLATPESLSRTQVRPVNLHATAMQPETSRIANRANTLNHRPVTRRQKFFASPHLQ